MFGRYSLDVDGLVLADQGATVSDYLAKMPDPDHVTFMPDGDNVLPITDDEYFDDDIVRYFIDFVRTVYGEETLEQNLAFIAEALGGKGTSREVIRTYFLKDFFKAVSYTHLINRSINGVVKVQDASDDSVRQELDEYVVTRELQGHFAHFFEAYDLSLIHI